MHVFVPPGVTPVTATSGEKYGVFIRHVRIRKHMIDPTRTFNEKIACSVSMTHVAMTFLRAVYSEKSPSTIPRDCNLMNPWEQKIMFLSAMPLCRSQNGLVSCSFLDKDYVNRNPSTEKHIFGGIRCYNLDLYPSPNNSQHQDYYMFSRESLSTFFCHCWVVGPRYKNW